MDAWERKINKDVGKDIIINGDDIQVIPRIPTGSLSLDVETGGGIPIGRITTIAGDYMDGKTAMTLKIVANFQKLWPNKTVFWIDAEGAWDPVWAKTLGVDVPKIKLAYPEYQEQALDIASKAVQNDVGLLVIDSIAALSPKTEAESDMETHTMGLAAKMNKKWLRKTQGALLDKLGDVPPTVILINQLYDKMSMYGGQQESGGKGLEYFPTLKIRLKGGDLFPKSKSVADEGVEPKAQSIRFFTEKNKTAPRHRRGHVWFFFDHMDEHRPKGSYDRIEEVVRYAEKYDLIKRRGKMYDIIDTDTGEVLFTGQGKSALADGLRDDEDLRHKVENKVMEIMNGKEAADVSKRFQREGEVESGEPNEPPVRKTESEGDSGDSAAE